MFDRLGKFFFSQLSPLFFFSLATLPILTATLFVYLQYTQLQDLQTRFASAARKEKMALQRKERKNRFLQRYANANPYFLDNHIESFALLTQEQKQIESFLPAFPNHPSFRERLRFLNENRLAFAEENIRTSSQVKEVEEKQRHTVQMDETDLKKILALIEDIPVDSFEPIPASPQLIIEDFRLTKVKTPLQTEAFEVDMQLLKREFTNP